MEVIQAITYLGFAFTITVLAIMWLLPLARRYGWVDHPNGGRKDHAEPTPMIGGIAVYVGLVVTTLIFIGDQVVPRSYVLSATLLVVVGALDDRFDLNWRVRILAQITAALILTEIGGVRADHLGPVFGLPDVEFGWLSLPISVIGIVGLINALNMIDGVDGLLGSLVLASLLMFIAAGVYAGGPVVVWRSFMVLGAICGFLLYNLRYRGNPRARLFMGNAGSMLLGFTIAHIAFRLTQNHAHPVTPVLATYLVAVPVIDCLVLLARRLRQGRSPFNADRDHVHHLLLDAGFSVNQTVAVLVLVSLLIGGGAAGWLLLGVPFEKGLLLLGYFGLLVGWYAFTCDRARAVARLSRLHRWLTAKFIPGP
ncbi:undecaprenyl-phosphate alpha-N-acetylglucosaminyl 1-phosphate transferase [Arenimonas maotaiensis]|uniref:Undecaprenyl-phosphate alpha-N-acetylglucosaminyl 1-phosphate transferase n=1 Tax=Arenimonas maotaiensis TaxID=1446479 RepID=A0A917CHS6_9GAMM|nr:MraY family glycosyltransferase [Arenimonas maotaiensis]GGF86134.1 undecaprenyl-phosphate alpha-N-acetylglucosaminyl 1-phosphate transferase [Arenimonas maotaiensis]